MQQQANTVDQEEIERFSRIADEWWDERGKFAPLHRINPLRVEWIKERLQDSGFGLRENTSPEPEAQNPEPLKGIRLLDIGCGGGLIAEPMARLGATVTAIDASEKNIAVAKLHAEKSGLDIDYRCTSIEGLQDSGFRLRENTSPEPEAQNPEPLFDVVLALEIIEHVADIPAFVESASRLVKPGGLLFMSTLNRTAKSYALAIVGAEYLLRWLPKGTHTWSKFVKPHELVRMLEKNNIEITDLRGMVMHPLTQQWRWDAHDLSVNYALVGRTWPNS